MSSWNLGLLGAAGAALPGAYELIQTTALGSNQASVIFSSIPNTYRHIQVRCVMKTTESSNNNAWSAALRLNGDTGSNSYAWHRLRGNGSDVASEGFSSTSQIPFGLMTSSGASTPSAVYSPGVIDILDYASTSKNKVTRSFVGGLAPASSSFIDFRSGLWLNTSAVTSLTLFPTSGNWVSGSRFSLYGLKGV
jgi:hypothetical protein